VRAQFIAAFAAGLAAGVASGQTSEVIYSVSASNESGSATWSLTRSDLGGLTAAGSPVDWQLDAPIELRDDQTGELIAVLENASSVIDPDTTVGSNSVESFDPNLMGTDPSINLSFSVIAGAADTTFTISSAELQISPALTDVVGSATAAITLTDGNGDGATMTGLVEGGEVGPNARDIAGAAEPPSNMYGAFLDDDIAGDNLITPFEFLIDSPVSTATTTSIEETEPFSGVRDVMIDPVEAMSAQFRFTLSAGDLASGTSRFSIAGKIVPAPSGAAALAVCGLAGLRRRRRS